MKRWTRIALVAGVILVVGTLVAAQIISLVSLRTANKIIESKDYEIEDKNQVIKRLDRDNQIIRDARDRWADTASATDQEKVQINCVLFDRVNNFLTVVAGFIYASPEIPTTDKEKLVPLLSTLEYPPTCPPLTN